MTQSNRRNSTFQSSFEWEPPALCIWRLQGDIDEADIERLYTEQARAIEGRPYVVVLLDLSRTSSISAQARKAAVKERGEMPVRASAAFGGSFGIRILATLVIKASAVFFPKHEHTFRFFDSEDEARAWLEQRRRDLGSSH